MSGVVLRASDHTYWTWNGARWQRVPGVNEIIHAAVPQVTRWFTDEARERGTLVHEALALHALPAGLDWKSLRADIEPYVEAGIEALATAGAQPSLIEQRLYHPTLEFAGSPDFVGRVFDGLAVVDYKSGAVPKVAGLATAGYGLLAKFKLGVRPSTRYALQLIPDAMPPYKFHPLHSLTEGHLDERRFLECLDLYRAYSFREDRIGETNVEPYDPIRAATA